MTWGRYPMLVGQDSRDYCRKWGVSDSTGDAMTTAQRFRCRFCSVTLPAWYAVPGEVNVAMLLHHMTQSHPAELKVFLEHMHTTDEITPGIMQAFEAVDVPGKETR